jgi:transcription factor IIIB subunit 2
LVLSAGLLGKRDNAVSDTALRIVASMKRDWMQASIFFVLKFYLRFLWKVVIVCPILQTGRKPSGLCGAALYIAALSHGYNYTKSNIVSLDAHGRLV